MEDHREQKLFAIINPNNETKNTTPTNPGLSSTNDATPCRGTIINNDDDNGSDAFVGTVTNNSQIVPVHHEDDSYYFNSFPPGYKFKPFDRELVVFYLQKKILHEPLPPNRIREVILYNYNPEELAAKYLPNEDKEWYFFTPRNRKYPNGDRPDRAAGKGYWKATGADKSIKFHGTEVGFKKSLVFYKGKPPRGDKTDWIMHEFRVNGPPRSKGAGDMKLDDYVLCRIYKKFDRTKVSTGSQAQTTKMVNRPEIGNYLFPAGAFPYSYCHYQHCQSNGAPEYYEPPPFDHSLLEPPMSFSTMPFPDETLGGFTNLDPLQLPFDPNGNSDK